MHKMTDVNLFHILNYASQLFNLISPFCHKHFGPLPLLSQHVVPVFLIAWVWVAIIEPDPVHFILVGVGVMGQGVKDSPSRFVVVI